MAGRIDMLRGLLGSALAAASPAGRFAHLPAPPAGRLLVLGGGKAGASMAKAFEQAYARPVSGLVVVPYGHGAPTRHVEVVEAAHPVPDRAAAAAATRLLALAAAATVADHVVFLCSGGASSLLALPAAGVTLADKQDIGRHLLRAGAAIGDLNTVRRSLSALKGGRLAAAAAPAPVTSYFISDVPGDDVAVIGSGPTVPQVIRAAAAEAILDSHGVRASAGVRAAMRANEVTSPGVAGPMHMLVRPRDALAAAATVAQGQGLDVVDLGAELEGEARVVAGDMARQALRLRGSASRPVVIVSGGELTVRVTGTGTGGCNLEFLLALALALDGQAGVHALAADTDGWDGNSAVAGAVVTPDTLARARAAGIDPAACLANNDAHTLFGRLGDLVDTGPTLTNVNDFRAVCVDPA